MSAPRIDVNAVDLYRRQTPTRIPFRFGQVTMAEVDVVYACVRFEVDGSACAGWSASTFSPMWFDKDPTKSVERRASDLQRSIRFAVDATIAHEAAPVWHRHRAIQPAVRTACFERGISALSSSFGVALLDAAVIDGLLRHAEFPAGVPPLQSVLFGGMLGSPEFEGDWPTPTERLAIRHTVGLVDPLSEADLDERIGDGLPETLEEVLDGYGVRWFKIKIGGDADADLERLVAIAAILDRLPGYQAVLDGNESYADYATFEPFVDRLVAEPRLARLCRSLAWIEQPVERDAALAPDAAPDLAAVQRHFAVILDESDGTDETVERALELGHRGMSAKQCKGPLRTLHTWHVLRHHGAGCILSAEDLTNPAVLPFQQDTAMVTALGLDHAERNAHHYVRGLEHLTTQEQAAALERFPKLYERSEDGLVRLAIRDGHIDTSELLLPRAARDVHVDVRALRPFQA